VIRDVPAAWVLRPPPLIGAEFPERTLADSVSVPELRMAPPPTPVVVLPLIWVWETLAVAPALFASPPPLPAVFPESLDWLTTRVPAF